MNLYQTLAAEIETQIACGVLLSGEKLPSVRQASLHRQMSVKTVLRACMLLESKGLVESRPQSGYVVRPRAAASPVPPPYQAPPESACEIDVSRLVLRTLRSIREQGAIPLGSPYPDPRLFPWQRISQYASGIARRHTQWNLLDDLPPGHHELIRQIARRHL